MNKDIRTLKKHSKSFYWAGMLLPRKTLQSVARLYAFCRKMDDAIDDDKDLEIVRISYENHKAGKGEISDILSAHEIPEDVFAVFMNTLQKDMPPVVYNDSASLLQFCYGVAGSVGVMMCHILGKKDAQTNYYAIDLGIAMQLVNIARDKHEDAQNDKYYIPPGHSQQSLVDLADHYFESGICGIHALPWAVRPAIATAAFLYRDIGRIIKKDPAYAQKNRVSVPKSRKVWLTICALYAVLVPKKQINHNPKLHEAISLLPCTHKQA